MCYISFLRSIGLLLRMRQGTQVSHVYVSGCVEVRVLFLTFSLFLLFFLFTLFSPTSWFSLSPFVIVFPLVGWINM
ncbi:hypothetical protein EV426DRAFT_628091 [Tirmania nivea]|nr:hypothetical protein EV426DRAFT_628091 [Tirmania nivea]